MLIKRDELKTFVDESLLDGQLLLIKARFLK